jgi:hypothetical protein
MGDIPKEAYPLIGALLGAFIGFGGTIITMLLTPRAQRALEEAKLTAARQDMLQKELLTRIQALTVDFASADHSMCWIAWAAEHDALSQESIKAYDLEMHTTLPKITGGVVSVAALDNDVYEVAKRIATQLYNLDADIGEGCLEFGKNRELATAKISKVARRVHEFEDVVLVELAEVAKRKTNLKVDFSVFAKPRSASRYLSG